MTPSGYKVLSGVAFAAFLAMSSVAAVAQERLARKVTDIVRASAPPLLDGRLDEQVWAEATVIADLHQYEPVDQGEPSESSIFYVFYDDDNLYVGARLLDSEPSLIAARQMVQGQTVEVDDRIEVVLDPFNNMRTGYRFQLNPNGVRRDGLFDRATNVNEDWDGIWHAEAVIDEQGWTAEIAIPFKTLNFNPNNPDWDSQSPERFHARRRAWPGHPMTATSILVGRSAFGVLRLAAGQGAGHHSLGQSGQSPRLRDRRPGDPDGPVRGRLLQLHAFTDGCADIQHGFFRHRSGRQAGQPYAVLDLLSGKNGIFSSRTWIFFRSVPLACRATAWARTACRFSRAESA